MQVRGSGVPGRGIDAPGGSQGPGARSSGCRPPCAGRVNGGKCNPHRTGCGSWLVWTRSKAGKLLQLSVVAALPTCRPRAAFSSRGPGESARPAGGEPSARELLRVWPLDLLPRKPLGLV